MKLRYDPATDAGYITFERGPSTESFELCDGIVIDLDADDQVVGIELEDISRKFDIEEMRAFIAARPVAEPARADAEHPGGVR